MTRIALLPSEPLRERMAGIGIRYLELARRLPRPGIEVVLLSRGAVEEVPSVPGEIRPFRSEDLPALVDDCDAVVAQGQLANDLLLAESGLPVAIDLYDPWLVEHFAYHRSLGLDTYRNDHATWVLQMSRGDFFLCSSEEQRLYYLGFLTALGRVHPERIAEDPDLRRLITPVPFGVPGELPPHRAYLDRDPEIFTVLFGGLYDWYDPWTLLEAFERLEDDRWRLLFIGNPNPEGTPQELLADVERWCRDRGWWGDRVEALPWVPAERRFDLLRDVDLLAAPHRPSLETHLSLRTRYLDALAAGCPVLLTEDGAMSRLVSAHRAGWVVPPRDRVAVAEALRAVREETAEESARRERGARELLDTFGWEKALEPLLAFCRSPWRDESKERFGFRPPTVTPAESASRRLRRRLRRWWRRIR